MQMGVSISGRSIKMERFEITRAPYTVIFSPYRYDDAVAYNIEMAAAYLEESHWQGEALNLIFAGVAAENSYYRDVSLCDDIGDRLCSILFTSSHYRNN